MSKTFFMGVQEFTFVENFTDEHGRKRSTFRFECAICRGKATVSLPLDATSSHSRRCAKHRLPGAMLGSKAEAVIIAGFGWPVAEGSVLEGMREEGSAWIVTELKLAAPVVARRDSNTTGSKLDANEDGPELHISPREYEMLAALREFGPADTFRIAKQTDVPISTIRVIAGRLQSKRMVKKTANDWALTLRGEDALDANPRPQIAPRLVSTVLESDVSEHAVIGLFD